MAISRATHALIISMIAKGLTEKQIAESTGVCKSTVGNVKNARYAPKRKPKPPDWRPFTCPIHHTVTPGGCVACQALAAKPKVDPLRDGSLALDLSDDEDARREACKQAAMLRKSTTVDARPSRIDLIRQ